MNHISTMYKEFLKPGLRFVSVDPGLGGTGWALFNNEGLAPIEIGVLNEQAGHWQSRARRIADSFGGIISGFGDPIVFIEWPGLWGGSARSLTSAERGDLFKLTYLIGAMSSQLKNIPNLIAPLAWKGQLPKDVVHRRLIRKLGEAYRHLNEHVIDAIGIGVALKGELGL